MTVSQKHNFGRLEKAYHNFSSQKKRDIKAKVMEDCDINEKTFYRWLKEPYSIRKPSRVIIARAFGKSEKTLFGLN